jgi:hypothetical protein
MMGLKDFDFKGFVLQKGERVGLSLSVLLMIALVIVGLFWPGKGVLSGSPRETADKLRQLGQSAQTKINSSDPPSGPIMDQTQLSAVLTFDRIEQGRFPTEFPFVLPSSADDFKRRNPDVLAPTEFHTSVVRGAMLGHELIVDKRDGKIKVKILVDKQFNNAQNRAENRGMSGIMTRMGGGMGTGGMMPGMMPGMGGPGGGDMDSPDGGMGGMYGPGGMPGMGGMSFGGPKQALQVAWVDHKELENKYDAKMAATLYPVRMVVVAASFPYKDQWEEFRRKLRRRHLNEVIAWHMSGEAPFQFSGFEIQRKVYGPDGKVKQDWSDFTKDMENAIKFLFARTLDYEQEELRLLPWADFGVLNMQLVLPRPMLAKQQKYPKEELKEVDEAVAALEKLAKAVPPMPPSARQRKLTGDFDIFNPTGGMMLDPTMMQQGMEGMMPGGMQPGMMPGGMQPGMMPGGLQPGMMAGGVGGKPGPGMMQPGMMQPGMMQPGMMQPGGMGGYEFGMVQQEPVLAEKCLVRFIDPAVQPGHSYEYRIKVKMINPNYQKPEEVVAYKSLTVPKEIVAKEWTDVPGRITVPNDVTYFAVDEKPEKGATPTPANSERIAVQIHRWLDYTLTSLSSSQIRLPVGDWSILERLLLHRGEYIGRMVPKKVPTWEATLEDYMLARDTTAKKNEVPVDFSTRLSRVTPPALLVDFQQGGRVQASVGGRNVYDEAQWQMLVLTPDGKLVLRNSREDTDNQDRQDRVKEHRDWVKRVESGQKTGTGTAGQNLFDQINPNAPRGGGGGTGRGGS